MTKQVQRRRGTATQHTSFTGAEGEISVNTTNKSIHVHDGTTAGGIEAARADMTNVTDANLNARLNGNTLSSLTITSADINGGTIDGTVIGGTTPAAVTGTTITGTSFVTTGDMTFGDSDKAIFGAGSDLQIYHDGSNSYITDAGTGDLKIRGAAVSIETGGGNLYFKGDANVAKLYHTNLEKLSTTSTGVDVTGTITSDGLTVQSGIADIRAGNIGPSNNPAVNIGREDTSITGGNPLGYVQFLGSDNTAGSLTPHAYIGALASGTHTAGSNPTELVFGTTAGGSETIVDRMLISSDGDISFYEDTGTTPKFFWDASAESLGIGTSSPEANLHIQNGVAGTITTSSSQLVIENNTTARLTLLTPNTNGGTIEFGDPEDQDAGRINYDHLGNFMRMYTAGSERMRIDSSGNLLVGTTDIAPATNNVAGISLRSTGHVNFSRDGGTVAYLNRKTSDGIIVDFRKDGTTVGGIGVAQGRLTIGNLDTGLKFDGSNDAILPWDYDGQVNRTNAISLGMDAVRFDDLYLNGQAFTGGGSAGAPAHTFAGDTDSGMFSAAANALAFSTGGNERMRIDSSGNVGVATTSPRTKLDIEGNMALDGGSATTSSTTQTAIDTYSASSFKGCKAVITCNDGTDTYVTELLIANTAAAAVATEYGQVGTGSALATFDVDVSGGNVRILATAASATSTTYKVAKTLM